MASDLLTMPIARPDLTRMTALKQTGGPQAYLLEQQADMLSWTRNQGRQNRKSLWHPAALQQMGWYSSRAGSIVDGQTRPLPWYCYAATQYLSTLAQTSWHVVEYGLGSSTLWWAARVQSITVIEHDPDWVERFETLLPPNVVLEFIEQSDPR